MPYYKDQEGNPHFLDNECHEHLLPFGSTQICKEEAERLAAEVSKKISAELEHI